MRSPGVEARGGFVHDNQLRFTQQRLGNAEALAHAARETAYALFAVVVQVHALQHGLDQGFAFFFVGDALEHGHVVEQLLGADAGVHAEFLRQVAQHAAQRNFILQHVDVTQLNAAAVGFLQSGDGAHER